MLATLTREVFSRPGWIFERKFDGERCLAWRLKRTAHLFSRNRKPLDETYPEISEALRTVAPVDCILDGEVVAFEGDATSFSLLQQRMQIHDAAAARRSPVRVFYYVFDLLFLDGRDFRSRPLLERKTLLRESLNWSDSVRFAEHREKHGERFYGEACSAGWEGLIAKNAASSYSSGRSRDWLKFKCSNRQEFVICGWTDPQGERSGFGALLVGYWDAGQLVYAGKVGTGYTAETLRTLSQRLRRLAAPVAPFRDAVRSRSVHWVKPELVCEVAFTEWTSDGKLRHPRFLGLRDDKNPRAVVRER